MILPFESQIPSQLQIRGLCSSFLRRGNRGQESLQCIFKQKELLKTKLGGTRKGREAHGGGGGVCEGSTPLDHRQGGVREG